MSKKRAGTTIPEPPWTFAPSEVSTWMASTAGPVSRRGERSRRPARVKGFVGRCPRSAEGKLLHRLAGLDFVPRERGSRLFAVFGRSPHPGDETDFQGKFGATQVHLRLRKGPMLELRVAFAPRLSYRRASKFLSQLGLRELAVTWM